LALIPLERIYGWIEGGEKPNKNSTSSKTLSKVC
jgi:hypothetical protein